MFWRHIVRKAIRFILIIAIFLFIFSLGIKSEIVEISDNIYSKDPYVLPFDNKVMVMWAEEVSGNFDLYYRICSGGAWGPKTRFNTGIYNSIYPQLELAPDGKVHAIWMGKISEARSIYHAYYTDGVWSTPEEVYPSTRRSCWPRLGIMSNGILCSVWTQAEGSNDQNTIRYSFKSSSSWAGGRLTDTPDTTSIHADLYALGDKVYACWMDAEGPYIWNLWFSQRQWGGNWTSPAIVASRYAQFPAMAVDSKGDVHSIFFGGGGDTPYYINRVNGSWSSPVQLPYLGKFTKSFVYLDVDKWDYLHAVWRQEHNGIDDIGYVIRDEQGNWGTPEYVSNSSAATGVGASKPLVRVDNNGYAHIVWLDRRSESVQDEGKIFYNSVQYRADPQTLNVYSAPFFEVPITVSPVDINGYGDGNTNFTRTYDITTAVTLTAPEISNGKNFERWIIDETNNYSRTINVTMDNEHSIVAIYQTDDITVMLPNGGENWQAYTIQNIYWLTPGTVTDVKIEYSTDNGTGWNDVVASTVNDGIYEWIVPSISSIECLIKISDISPSGPPPDTSDAVFTISEFVPASYFIKDGSWTSSYHGTDVWYVGDFNGDGRDDIFRYMPGTSGADVFLSDGTKFVHNGSWTGYNHGTDGWSVGNFDGDSDFDIFRYRPGVSGAEVFLAKYTGATASSFYGYNVMELDDNMIKNQNVEVREELSFEEEEQIIERFKLKLYSGELPNIYEIKSAFEEKMNRRVRRVEIINILSKHGYWELIKGNKNIKIKDRIAPERK